MILLQEHPVYKGYFGLPTGEIFSNIRTIGINQLSPQPNHGRMSFYVRYRNSKLSMGVDQFISDIFLPLQEGKTSLVHLDGNKTNNSIENLKRVSPDHFVDEEYMEHPVHKGYYITKAGKVYSTHLDKFGLMCEVRSHPDTGGYLNVAVAGKTRILSRLVAETFLPNPNDLPEVNHIDENKLNNSVSNLEWVTKQQNMDHSYFKIMEARGCY